MDQRCHTFSFGHYHQVPGASCGILYILVLSLVLFMQSLYPLSNHLLVITRTTHAHHALRQMYIHVSRSADPTASAMRTHT